MLRRAGSPGQASLRQHLEFARHGVYRGLDGYAQWAFQWWKEDQRIVWMEPQTHRVTISPAYCGFRDGWRDAVLLHQLIAKAGRAEYEKIVGRQATAALRVAMTKDPTYPLEHGSIPSTTSIANAADQAALNAARRQALKTLAELTRGESVPGNPAPIAPSLQKQRGGRVAFPEARPVLSQRQHR